MGFLSPPNFCLSFVTFFMLASNTKTHKIICLLMHVHLRFVGRGEHIMFKQNASTDWILYCIYLTHLTPWKFKSSPLNIYPRPQKETGSKYIMAFRGCRSSSPFLEKKPRGFPLGSPDFFRPMVMLMVRKS